MNVPVVHSLGDAHLWAKQGLARIHEDADAPWKTLGWSPVSLLSGKTLKLSTACTGVDTPVFSGLVLSKAVESVESLSGQEPVKIENIHGCEKDTQCQDEVLYGPHPPHCLFDNMLLWLSPQANEQLKVVKDNDYDKIRAIILREPLRSKAHCRKHKGPCFLRWSHINVGGTPCIHHSTFGLMDGFSGSSNKVYYVWCRQRFGTIEFRLFRMTIKSYL